MSKMLPMRNFRLMGSSHGSKGLLKPVSTSVEGTEYSYRFKTPFASILKGRGAYKPLTECRAALAADLVAELLASCKHFGRASTRSPGRDTFTPQCNSQSSHQRRNLSNSHGRFTTSR